MLFIALETAPYLIVRYCFANVFFSMCGVFFVGTGVLDCPKTIDYNQSKIGIVFLILALLLQLTSFIFGQYTLCV